VRIQYAFLLSAMAASLTILALQIQKEEVRQLRLIQEMYTLREMRASELEALLAEANAYVKRTKVFQRKYRSELATLSDYRMLLFGQPTKHTAGFLLKQLAGDVDIISIPADTFGQYALLVASDLISNRVRQIVQTTKPKPESSPVPIPVLRDPKTEYTVRERIEGKFDFFYPFTPDPELLRAIVDGVTISKPIFPLCNPHKIENMELFVKNKITAEESSFTASFE
jgi:hypothetical protein